MTISQKIIIKNGRIIDPVNNIDRKGDLLIDKGLISTINDDIKEADAKIIDAVGKWVCPGLIDIHTHLREPGFEYKETVATGAASAVAGGFTSVACMANTDPVNDNAEVTRYIQNRAKEAGLCNVFVIGAVTKGLKGKELSDIGDLAEAGVVALSDDGHCVDDADIMRSAMEYAKMFDLTIIEHAEDRKLCGGGAMNEGSVSTTLGLPGQPAIAEDVVIARDIQLAEYLNTKIHIAHVSTHGAVDLIRAAKARGIRISAEVTPHHLTLTHEACRGYDTNAKMAPPLRQDKDVLALVNGLVDGTIDCIATDHAPHASNEKDVEFERAAFGIVGFETAIPLCFRLFTNISVTTHRIIEALTIAPAKIIGIDRGSLSIGAVADVTIIDPDLEWTVDPAQFVSKGKNSPFGGWAVKGRAVITIVDGKVVYEL